MLKFSIYSSKGDHKFEINEENDTTIAFYQKLLLIFSTVDYEKHIVNFICTQQMSDIQKGKISSLIKEFEVINIKLRQIEAYFNEIPNGEYFFVFPETNFTIPQVISLFESIKLLNEGVPFEEINEKLKKPMNDFTKLFSDVIKNYDVSVFSPKRKTLYGEKDKKKRVCKYCGKRFPETTFNEEAHAISEAIGNKTMISTEECDNCNHRFASSIEKDLFEYLKLYRVLYGKKGKSKIPELQFKNGINITYKDNKAIIIDHKGSACLTKNGGTIPLEFPDKVNFMNIYRCLVKFVVAVLPMEIVNSLNKTINWINSNKNDGAIIKLPPVAHLVNPNTYFDQPEITVYIRKNNDYNLPYIYCEFKVEFFVFVYIIPFTSKDKIDFSEETAFSKFWSFNKHYNHFNTWVFNHFDLDQEKELKITMNFESRQKNS